jgi:hypothetical protein
MQTSMLKKNFKRWREREAAGQPGRQFREIRGRAPPRRSMPVARPRRAGFGRTRLISGNGRSGGEGGIRTHGRLAPTTVFETAPIDHSGTSPRRVAAVFRASRDPLQPLSSRKLEAPQPAPHLESARATLPSRRQVQQRILCPEQLPGPPPSSSLSRRFRRRPSRTRPLFRALGMPEIIEVMREEGVAYGETIRADLLQGQGGRGLDGDRLRDLRRGRDGAADARGFERRLEGVDLEPLFAFFDSERGRRIVELEVSARRAFSTRRSRRRPRPRPPPLRGGSPRPLRASGPSSKPTTSWNRTSWAR